MRDGCSDVVSVDVARVECFCTPDEWLRAYSEINDFEEQLVDADIVVVKFWLTIDKKTQLKRFKELEETVFKRFKITEEDWRNRERWDDYGHAVADMVDRTSTVIAPWTLVEANDKRRSEEHTSELQSLMRISYAVFCLKKKKQRTTKNHITNYNKSEQKSQT